MIFHDSIDLQRILKLSRNFSILSIYCESEKQFVSQFYCAERIFAGEKYFPCNKFIEFLITNQSHGIH